MNNLLDEIIDTMKNEKDALHDHIIEDLKMDSYVDEVILIDTFKSKLYSITLEDVIDAVLNRCATFVESYKEDN